MLFMGVRVARLLFVLTTLFAVSVGVKCFVGHDENAERQMDSVAKWAMGSGKDSLDDMCCVLMKHHNRTEHLLKDLLALVQGWTVQENEVLSREGVGALKLIVDEGPSCSTNPPSVLAFRFVRRSRLASFVEERQVYTEYARLLFEKIRWREIVGYRVGSDCRKYFIPISRNHAV